MSRREGRRSRGFYGVATWSPKSVENVGCLWRTAWLYDAAFLATIGQRYYKQPADTPGVANQIPLTTYADWTDFVSHVPDGCALVGVELCDESKALPKFSHPERAVYLLGAEDHGIPSEYLSECDAVIQIPAPKEFSMNVAVAGSIVLYDRFMKRG